MRSRGSPLSGSLAAGGVGGPPSYSDFSSFKVRSVTPQAGSELAISRKEKCPILYRQHSRMSLNLDWSCGVQDSGCIERPEQCAPDGTDCLFARDDPELLWRGGFYGVEPVQEPIHCRTR
jgi:hypothetical protein